MVIRRRKEIRLKNYDYPRQGMYFITICTKNRQYLFGEIIKGKMILNEMGKIAKEELMEIKNYFGNIALDIFVIMPNHVHLIIEILSDVGADLVSAQKMNTGQTQGLSLHNHIGLLSKIIQKFKSITTVEYIRLMKRKYGSYDTRIWQRSFYDHIIRNHHELNRIREYIFENPSNWEHDCNNPENIFM